MNIKGVSKSIDSDSRNFSSTKPRKIFQFFKTGILSFQSVLTRIRPIFQILKTCKYKYDLNIFLNGPNFTRNGIIIPILLVKAIFFTSYSPENRSCSSRSMNISMLAKVLILTFFSSVGLKRL